MNASSATARFIERVPRVAACRLSQRQHRRRQRERSALIDAFESRCLDVQYPAHGSARRRVSRRGTVVNVHRSGPPLSSGQSSGIETIAPARARGEKAQTDVFVRLFRR